MAVSALLILLALSPLMRGGNRQVALVALEGISLAFLAALLASAGGLHARLSLRNGLLALLLTSPLWLALVYLLPVPASLWAATPGRGVYPDLLAAAGIPAAGWLPLSLVPDATASSLMAGIPIAAAFVAGLALRLPQLKLVLTVFAGVAFLQVVMGLLQMAGGTGSSLYFGGTPGRPFGTFANPNHFANYLAMALAAYVWLAWSSVSQWRRRAWAHHPSARTRLLAVWAAGGVLLLIGILMSHSRGAALAGLPAALCAFAVAATAGPRGRAWRATLVAAGLALAAAISLVGFEFVFSRFQIRSLTADASFRELLATSTLQGAAQFWPWGTGWGTYAAVFPRFQPPTVVGTANFAHNDYAQLLFEGGIFALLLAAAFAWLVVTRAVQLVRAALAHGRLRREEMAAALCGLGLLGFLLHSLVEFNMHIPATAIAAALLAGAYLRPLAAEEEPAGD